MESRMPSWMSGCAATSSAAIETATAVTDDEPLAFSCCFCDGGQYGENYRCSNMFRDDASCYCSLKSGCVNVVAQYSGGPSFTLTSLEVAAPVHGFTSPLVQGVLFTSWEAPDIKQTLAYDHVWDSHDFQELAAQQASLQACESASTPSPVLFFDLGAKFRSHFVLDVPRSGRFVLLKLLRARHRHCDNIDVQYIGLRGWRAPRGFACAAMA